MQVDLTVVKQEVMEWLEMEEGLLDVQWVKQEMKDGPEVKEAKPSTLEVKKEIDIILAVIKEKAMNHQ